MAKLRCNSINDPLLRHLEFEGTPQELLTIYDGLKQRQGNTLQIGNNVEHQFDPTPKSIVRHPHIILNSECSELTKKMPMLDQLVIYILGKPKFEHDIIDVEMQFFGKQIKSRQYGRLYRELRAKLENARKTIESSQHGAFERRSTHPRNLQRYSFKPMNSVLFEPQPQKPS
jgi:hypothetical protein